MLGLDDLAPASGLGAQTPEPATFALLGSALMGLIALRRRATSIAFRKPRP